MKTMHLRTESGFTNIRSILMVISLFLLAILTVSAQNERPRPTVTPTPFEPEVVSRDSDLENSVREITRDPAVTGQDVPSPVQTDRARVPRLGLEALSKEEQSRLLLYLDILTKMEQRAESLRGQLIAMIEKQNNVTTKIQQVDYNLRPEVIAGYTALTGSFRPEDLRDQRKAELEIEKANLENLLRQIDSSIQSLEDNLRRADTMVERVRSAFEAVLEAALSATETP